MTAIADILAIGIPFAVLAIPSIVIYLILMNFITKRAMVDGVDVKKEKVRLH